MIVRFSHYHRTYSVYDVNFFAILARVWADFPFDLGLVYMRLNLMYFFSPDGAVKLQCDPVKAEIPAEDKKNILNAQLLIIDLIL